MENRPLEILLIEDDPAQAAMIGKMLAESLRQGVSVRHAKNLADGLGQLARGDFDIILVALGLPDSQGLQTALSVRNRAQATPVIVLTMHEDEDIALKALQMDIQDYLVKGEINGTTLKRSIRYAIQRKQDTEALRQSEQRFASFMLHLPAAAWMKDLQGRYVYANTETERIFSMPLSEFTGKGDAEFLSSETAGPLRENDQRVLAEGGSLRTTETMRQIDGVEGHYIVSKFSVPGPDGRPGYVGGVAFDITELVRAEEALHLSEERFRALITASSQVLYRMSPDWSEMREFHSRGFLASTETPSSNWLQEYISPDDQPQVVAAIREAIRTRSMFELEHRVRRADGSLGWTWSRAVPLMDAAGRITEWFGTANDITTRKEAEEALRKSEKKFAKVFHAVPALIAISTLEENKYLDVNETALQLLGYRREEVVGRTATELDLWEDPSLQARVQQTLKEHGHISNLEVRFRGKNGQIFTGLLSAEYVSFNGDHYRLGLVKDISDRKAAEEEIARLNIELTERAAELEAANRELDAFTYTVAHDLRKPLAVVSGYCQALRELCEDTLDEECRGFLAAAYDGTWRMNQLIDTLLDFSRLTHSEPRREAVDLSGMAQAIAAELALSEPKRRAEFLIAEGVSVMGDADLLRVVMVNLLGNAWKYTGSREQAVIEFGVKQGGEEKTYFVRDNGPGFDMADADKLFVPFRRIAEQRFDGHGVGLATVERIVRRHGGQVWAEGEPGTGAVFYFTLPG
ncbi:PAS domain S-box protein [Geobacter sp. SVR]|uniref:PAS domain S-box protein n=1 Tax=Geobacter sp. SVR TaxID=2495594 RepID=UPI00156585CC|nr:PAS domain S-box protein [Geobacter sp. SVR]